MSILHFTFCACLSHFEVWKSGSISVTSRWDAAGDVDHYCRIIFYFAAWKYQFPCKENELVIYVNMRCCVPRIPHWRPYPKSYLHPTPYILHLTYTLYPIPRAHNATSTRFEKQRSNSLNTSLQAFGETTNEQWTKKQQKPTNQPLL